MATIKKKVNLFNNKLQKAKQKKFSRDKVPNNQETRKKNHRYKKERKTHKMKELAEIKKNLPNENAINLTNVELSQLKC